VRETLCVLGFVALACLVTAAGVLPSIEIVRSGQTLMLASAAIGIPLELIYFATLGCALRFGSVGCPPGWFWRPFLHHDRLSASQRLAVLPLFYLGALAFIGIVLGVAIVVLGMLSGLNGGG